MQSYGILFYFLSSFFRFDYVSIKLCSSTLNFAIKKRIRKTTRASRIPHLLSLSMALSFTPFLNTIECLVSLFMAVEGRKAHVTLATGTKADARRTDDIRTIEQCLEEGPRTHTIRGTHPDIWCILATVAFITQCTQTFQHALSVVHIIIDGGLDLLLTLRSINGLSSSLRDIARAIELRTLAAQPQLVQGDAFTLEGGDSHFLFENEWNSTAHLRAPRIS